MSKGGGVSIPGPNYTFKIGSDGSTIHLDTDLDNIHIKEIAPVTVNSNLAVTQPIVTESTSKSDSTANLDLKVEPLDLKIEPIKADVDTNSVIDLKPVAVDSCTTIKLAPLPPIRVEQPYSTHFGLTYMGMELFGFNMSGKSEVFLHSPPKPQYHSMHTPEPQAAGERPSSNPTSSRPRSGLRVRIGDNQ